MQSPTDKRKSLFSRRSTGRGKFSIEEDTKCLDLNTKESVPENKSVPKLLGVKAVPSFRQAGLASSNSKSQTLPPKLSLTPISSPSKLSLTPISFRRKYGYNKTVKPGSMESKFNKSASSLLGDESSAAAESPGDVQGQQNGTVGSSSAKAEKEEGLKPSEQALAAGSKSSVWNKLNVFKGKRKKSEEVNQGTESTVVEQRGLESPKERIKQVYCVEPAEVAEPDTVIHINDSLVRSDSNASSYFVDVPEPVPDTPSDAYSDGDYATPLTPVTPREEFEESMEDQVRVLSLPTKEDYEADEERLDHMRQESVENLKAFGHQHTHQEELEKLEAGEVSDLLNIPEENRQPETSSVEEESDLQDPAKVNPDSHLEQQLEDEREQIEYEEEHKEGGNPVIDKPPSALSDPAKANSSFDLKQQEEAGREQIECEEEHKEGEDPIVSKPPSKGKRRNKHKHATKSEKPIKHALSTESFERNKNEEKKLKPEKQEIPVAEQFSKEKGGYEDDTEPSLVSTESDSLSNQTETEGALKIKPSSGEKDESEDKEEKGEQTTRPGVLEHVENGTEQEQGKDVAEIQMPQSAQGESQNEFNQEKGGYEDDIETPEEGTTKIPSSESKTETEESDNVESGTVKEHILKKTMEADKNQIQTKLSVSAPGESKKELIQENEGYEGDVENSESAESKNEKDRPSEEIKLSESKEDHLTMPKYQEPASSPPKRIGFENLERGLILEREDKQIGFEPLSKETEEETSDIPSEGEDVQSKQQESPILSQESIAEEKGLEMKTLPESDQRADLSQQKNDEKEEETGHVPESDKRDLSREMTREKDVSSEDLVSGKEQTEEESTTGEEPTDEKEKVDGEERETLGKEKQVNGDEQIASEESPITEGSPSKKPVHVAESEEKVKKVFEDIEKISEGMELIVDETRSEDENGGEEEKTLAAKIIDENPDVNPADILVAIKRLGDFAECSVSEAVQELRTDKETGEMLPEARKERSDTMESYGLTYDEEFGSDSSDERTTTGSSKPPEDREAAAEDSSMLLRKWSKGVEPNTLEDLPEADQSPDWRQRERKSTDTKGQLEKPVGLTRVELTRTEIHPSILSEINSEFVDKFLELPIIDTGLNYAYLLYTSVKGTCPDLVQRLLFDSTERSALVALQITKWLLKPFTLQLRTVDHLAAQTLVAIEDRLLPQAS